MVDPCATVRSFVAAYGVADVETMRAALTDDFVGYVTNADAGADRVDGPDAYLARLPDVAAAGATATITQTVQVAANQALTMVEIRATRDGRELHNFGAFWSRHEAEGRIAELWMVDARPAHSDEFWS